MLRMTRAIYRTQKWLHQTDIANVANAIREFFPDMPQEMLSACITRYQSLGLWGKNPILPRSGFDRLQASGHSGGLFSTGAAYETCVDNSLAKEVIAADPPSM